MGEDPDRMAHPSAPYGAAQPFEPCDVAIDVPLAVEAPRNGRSAVLVKGVLLVGAALVLAAVVSQQSAAPAATASTTSVDTTTLFRGTPVPKCGPTDDACCDQFSPSVTRHKGGGYNMGSCVQAGCSGSVVFNFHPAPGRPLPSFDGGQFPQGHCVPTHYRPKPGDANSPARAKREAATTSLGSDDTTELFRGRGVKCGPTDDACCDKFSPSVGRVKGGGWKVGDNCVNAGCSAAPVFNYHPVPGRPLPHFDGIQFPQGHCVPTHYAPKPGDSRKPAFAKREAATTSLSYTRYVGTDCHKTKHGHLRCKGKKKVRCHKTSHGNTRCH